MKNSKDKKEARPPKMIELRSYKLIDGIDNVFKDSDFRGISITDDGALVGRGIQIDPLAHLMDSFTQKLGHNGNI